MDLRKDTLFFDALVDFPTYGQEDKLYLDKANGALYYWDGSAYALAGDGTGGVTAVTATAPIASSGGATPDISITQASGSVNGYLSSTDWNTFNGKQNALTLTTTGTSGAATLVGSTLNIPNYAGGSTGGKFGIADSNGAYTYYTTLQAAITAASAGQTVEMFTDYTETTATTVTLKNGVNINGNGHTYTYTNPTGNCFIDNGVTVTCVIQNLIVNRTSHTSGNVVTLTNQYTVIDFTGSKLNCTSASSNAYVVVCGGEISNLNVLATGANLGGINIYSYAGRGVVINSYVVTTGAGSAIVGDGAQYHPEHGIYNCYGKSVSGTGLSAIKVINSIGWSTSGTGIGAVNVYSSTGVSSSSYGLSATYAYNSTGISSSGIGIRGSVYNCNGNSSSGNAYFADNASTVAHNSSFYTAGAAVVSYYHVGNYYNCSLESTWNNANGHCIVDWDTMVSSTQIVNCTFKVTNTSANAINAANVSTPKYSSNVFIGMTNPVNANITQGITNTEDNQGNILL